MQEISESPEHHFLDFSEKIKGSPENWAILYFGMSQDFDLGTFLSRSPEHFRRDLIAARKESLSLASAIQSEPIFNIDGFLYHFADNDVLAAVNTRTKVEEIQIENSFKELCKKVGTHSRRAKVLKSDPYALHKLGDEKILGMKKVEALSAMADANKTRSLASRRKRRADPLVLIIEDDRFTASYTANILNKDYDLIHARTGEEGLLSYLDNPPDIVFLDIHLPGLSGHQVLQAIRKIDPDGFAIMLSVDSERTNVVTASDGGANGFLKKPVSRDRLLAAALKSPHIRKHRRTLHTDGLPTQFS